MLFRSKEKKERRNYKSQLEGHKLLFQVVLDLLLLGRNYFAACILTSTSYVGKKLFWSTYFNLHNRVSSGSQMIAVI